MAKPKLQLFTLTKGTEQAVLPQLYDLFGEFLDIESIVYDKFETKDFTLDADLVLLTSTTVLEIAADHLKEGVPTMLCKRLIPFYNIDKLYDIEPGSDVIISNVTEHDVKMVMEQLESTGIIDFNMIPHVYGEPLNAPNAKYVVVFGEEFNNYSKDLTAIDMGSRVLDSLTCYQIADFFDLPESFKETLSSEFVKPSIKIAYNYYEQLRENQDLYANLNAVLNNYDKSTFVVDENGEMPFFNYKARRILGDESDRVRIAKLIFENYKEFGNSFFMDIDGENYYVNISKTENSNYIIVIDEMKEIEKISNEYKNKLTVNGLVAKYKFKDIIASSDSMKSLLERAKQFAKSDSTIHISGESGCGKELIAQAIHNASNRKDGPFVAVNFAALTESLCESELFGYVGGSFTGAKKGGEKGLFELADKGTIFLDEIGDCSLEIQKKILRVIQERKVLPVGGNALIPVDIRIISATNQDLEKLVDNKLFRDDLFYRLNVLPLKIKPLRERTNDILPMFYGFLNNDFKVHISSVGKDLEGIITSYSWKGNGRELKNIAEYIASCVKANVENWEEEVKALLAVNDKQNIHNDVAKDNSIMNKIEAELDIHNVFEVLKVLSEPPYTWTRATIMNALPELGESQIKRIITCLSANNIVVSKRGGGTRLTKLGRDLYESLASELIKEVQ